MKMIHAVIVFMSALAMLLLAPLGLAANARSGGFGAHTFHFAGLHRSASHLHSARSRGAFGQWPFFGGIVAVPPYASDNILTYAMPERVVFVPEPPRALSCHHSQETVTVPSEEGGTRQITITRC
jgi:hypothetical protein